MILRLVLYTIWLYLPAYFANATPVAFGGGPPLDRGLSWRDGRPLLGGHKTLRGCVVGILAGALVGSLQGRFLAGLAQGVGAIVGDLISSFFKRRLGIPPGDSFPLLDQLDFIVVAVLLSQPFVSASLEKIAVIMVVTVPIHYAMNYVSWLTKMKEHPW